MAVDMERRSITAEPVVVSPNGTAPAVAPGRREIGVGAGVALGGAGLAGLRRRGIPAA